VTVGGRLLVGMVFAIAAITPAVQLVSAKTPAAASVGTAHTIARNLYEPTLSRPFNWNPEIAEADFRKTAGYKKGGFQFVLYSSGFYQQPEQRQIVDELDALIPSHWQMVGSQPADRVSIIRASAGGQPMVLLRWVNVGGDVTANRLQAKLLRLGAQLHGRPDVTLNGLAASCRDEACSAEIDELQAVFDAMTSAGTAG